MTAIVCLVVARAANGVIGRLGQIPWHIPADLKHFRAVTMGKPCIMGRKTWESLPRKPLPGRTNIVITRDRAFRAEGGVVAHSFEEALSRAQADSPDEIAVIGGADIYHAALPYAHRIYLTEVHCDFDGDVYLPPFNAVEWKEVWREDHKSSEVQPAFSFVMLERTEGARYTELGEGNAS